MPELCLSFVCEGRKAPNMHRGQEPAVSRSISQEWHRLVAGAQQHRADVKGAAFRGRRGGRMNNRFAPEGHGGGRVRSSRIIPEEPAWRSPNVTLRSVAF